MSRVKAFVAGLAAGGVAYAGLSIRTQEKLRNLEYKVIAAQEEAAGVPPALRSENNRVSVLQEYKNDITTSFRHNWNNAIEKIYGDASALLTPATPEQPAAAPSNEDSPVEVSTESK